MSFEDLLCSQEIENWVQQLSDEALEQYHYLENKTIDLLEKEKRDLGLSEENLKRLKGYRYVDEINELKLGTHCRWVRPNGGGKAEGGKAVTNGGIVTTIKYLDSGIQVLCKNNAHRFIQYKFDNVYSFQKLSAEEFIILMSNEMAFAESPN